MRGRRVHCVVLGSMWQICIACARGWLSWSAIQHCVWQAVAARVSRVRRIGARGSTRACAVLITSTCRLVHVVVSARVRVIGEDGARVGAAIGAPRREARLAREEGGRAARRVAAEPVASDDRRASPARLHRRGGGDGRLGIILGRRVALDAWAVGLQDAAVLEGARHEGLGLVLPVEMIPARVCTRSTGTHRLERSPHTLVLHARDSWLCVVLRA